MSLGCHPPETTRHNYISYWQKARQESSLKVSDFVKWSDFKRPFVSKKCNGGVSFQEGESPMTFEGYNFVCLQALQMKESWKQSIFADLFLSWCWNQIHGAIRLSDAAGIAKLYPSNVIGLSPSWNDTPPLHFLLTKGRLKSLHFTKSDTFRELSVRMRKKGTEKCLRLVYAELHRHLHLFASKDSTRKFPKSSLKWF